MRPRRVAREAAHVPREAVVALWVATQLRGVCAPARGAAHLMLTTHAGAVGEGLAPLLHGATLSARINASMRDASPPLMPATNAVSGRPSANIVACV